MAEHNIFGKLAEDKSVEYLKCNGYNVLERNWIYNKAEIDIIALEDDTLVIVEVRARNKNYIIAPEETISVKKKKLLIMAADKYITDENLDNDIRFDVISIVKDGDKYNLTHIKDAFNSIL